MIHVAFNGFPRETLSQNLRDERGAAGVLDVTGLWDGGLGTGMATLWDCLLFVITAPAPALLASSSEESSSEQSGCCSLESPGPGPASEGKQNIKMYV